ncbi:MULTISPECIES: DUF4124 domain-containing protein [unclassified Undibacterium]|uniref:DUF4124 domain-containing protein n=1 Tax=unclassified Undibacterium TaxID=2630295 RepID=UPI002AC9D688|nr:MULTISPECIES: DUF4124 domain-containing protein [unclassified Undibacterium]MEB0139473.1 DUF4124 domain-containing protein [Undibacterium sp. CCC2.1]MEB0171645.1 DUF4124 domain-containing protein [Undibacterium sp. CCC1.1]MEB0176217.1 DUF4124 domain-containing protein [Undibacterium sp. CCC3.4]MEB0214990.1 DUF4124 domain-containing protein [Undibacterium sp. 5I2]WPX43228.1 DUF4124 domain-containing protein [Undibacterium sp. CCC3.4]
MSNTGRCLFSVLFMLSCANASAQYVWVDEKGVKQFTDTPPPASIASKKILKNQSNSLASKAAEPEAKPTPATLSSRNEDYNKRRVEQAEKDRKAAADQQLADNKKQNCERARSYQQSLDGGSRIVRTDKNGQRNFLDDAERQKESEAVKKHLADC